MKNTRQTKWHLLAAVAALPLLVNVGSSMGQERIGGDGRLLDANNQVGSGGSNGDPGSRQVTKATGNDIVTGNVTGGREFRGNVPYSDPRAFRGGTAGTSVDRFIAASAGAATPYQTDNSYNAYTNGGQAFYGSSRGVNAPMGSQEIGSTGAYIPAPDVTQRQLSDQRLGDVLGVPQGAQQPIGGNPIGGVNNNPYLPNSLDGNSLYGMPNAMLQNTGASSANSLMQRRDQQLTTMRQELINSSDDADLTHQSTDLTGQALDQTPGNGTSAQQPLSGSTNTQQSTRQNMALPPAIKQSTQYAEMQRRLDAARMGRPKTDVDAARELAETRRLLDKAGTGQLPTPTTPANPNLPQNPVPSTPAPQTPANPQIPAATPSTPAPARPTGPLVVPDDKRVVEPLQIKSLAEGIKAEGLHDTLAKAEQNVREGQYLAALDGYDTAEQVAPNNPLVQMGKANALLGGFYFARAEATYRQAYSTDPALLMAQYDLRTMIGEERLAKVVKQLKTIANTEKNDPQAMFLLAYIAYNTGSEELAGQYLRVIQQQDKRPDPVINAMLQYWKLPAAPAAGNSGK